MKKLFSILLGLCLLSAPAFAGQWTTASLINGQFLVISNNSTTLWADTNVFYVDSYGIARWSYQLTNMVPTTGSNGTNFSPAANYYTNAAAFTSTNALAGGYNTNGGGYLNPGAFTSAQGWPDAMGKATDNSLLSVTVWGAGSRAVTSAGAPTNTITLTIVKGGTSYTNMATDNVLNYDTMVLVFAATAGTNATFTTNLPTTFTAGARRIEIAKIDSSNVSSGTNVVFKDISITGFVP